MSISVFCLEKRSCLFTMPMKPPCTFFTFSFSPLPWVVYSWYISLSVLFLYSYFFKNGKHFWLRHVFLIIWLISWAGAHDCWVWFRGGWTFAISCIPCVDEAGSNFLYLFYFPAHIWYYYRCNIINQTPQHLIFSPSRQLNPDSCPSVLCYIFLSRLSRLFYTVWYILLYSIPSSLIIIFHNYHLTGQRQQKKRLFVFFFFNPTILFFSSLIFVLQQ